MKKIQAIKGTYDILPGEVEIWQHIEEKVRYRMRMYGYSEIRTPVFEETGLFARSIGEDTDIVGKEMYTFNDMGNRSLTLRPEGTASVIRAFIEHSLDQKGLPQSLWYMGPMFRQERPQKGRQRQFHQFGAEIIGSPSPLVDADMMILFDDIVKDLGLNERVYALNFIGRGESRQAFTDALVAFLDTVEDNLCDDCKRRKATNPLRVLDCKVPSCREAVHDSERLPKTVDFLDDDDTRHYGTVKNVLHDYGVAFVEDPYLVRGLDYYTGTIFEMNCSGLGAQSAIMGGGRYDNLIKDLGGPDLPATGFACGMERLVLAIEAEGSVPDAGNWMDVYLIDPVGDNDSQERTAGYLKTLRKLGYTVMMDYMRRSMKSQMKSAARANAGYALIIESEEGMVSARNMGRSEQEMMTFDAFLDKLKNDKDTI